ncbi:MAG: glycosyltransferase family 2 protein [Pyrinomonadaceae bacterium MAG19_C2-C3]|nr:glycosyltransferase family 2 protein [Pyrinomonadaceae bacterium MAG19_C2-C3]
MNDTFDVSVVICTYNRAAMLAPAIEGVLRQASNGVRYELVVVDNNSTDETRSVIESYIENGVANLRYVFEDKQGLSHARNAGIVTTKAPIIAFTDDDVRAESNWVSEINQTFDAHPEVAYVGGKVLPLWEREPPAWLTVEHWAPLAIIDYGEAEFYVDANRPMCLVGANLVVRREAFEKVGMFATEFQRVEDSIGSAEDHEWQLRVWQAGMRGLYAPRIVIAAEVQADRLDKAYHRRWHTGHGGYAALMRLYEITDENSRLQKDLPADTVTLFGSPAYMYRNLIVEITGWFKAAMRRNESVALHHEVHAREFISYLRKRYEMTKAARTHSNAIELGRFAAALLSKKVERATPAKT